MRLSDYLRNRERDYRNKKNIYVSMVEKNGVVYSIQVRFASNCDVSKFQSIVECIHDGSDGVLMVTSGLAEFGRGVLSIKVDHDRRGYESIDERLAVTIQILLEHWLPNL